MSILIECPSCDKQLKAAEEKHGKKIRCPSCQEVFTVPAATKKSRPADADDDEGFADKPIAARRRPAEDHDEVPHRSPRSRRDDDDGYDDDDEPRRRKGPQKKGSALPWILAGTGGGVVVLTGIVVAVILLTKGSGQPEKQRAAQAPPANVQPVAQAPAAQNPGNVAAPVQPPVQPAQPADLIAMLRKLPQDCWPKTSPNQLKVTQETRESFAYPKSSSYHILSPRIPSYPEYRHVHPHAMSVV